MLERREEPVHTPALATPRLFLSVPRAWTLRLTRANHTLDVLLGARMHQQPSCDFVLWVFLRVVSFFCLFYFGGVVVWLVFL